MECVRTTKLVVHGFQREPRLTTLSGTNCLTSFEMKGTTLSRNEMTIVVVTLTIKKHSHLVVVKGDIYSSTHFVLIQDTCHVVVLGITVPKH